MFYKYSWDNIAQENYWCNVGPERTDILSQENRLFQICLVACFLTGFNITEQSWLFLFNVGSGVHLRLMYKWYFNCYSFFFRVVKNVSKQNINLFCSNLNIYLLKHMQNSNIFAVRIYLKFNYLLISSL